MDQPVTEYRDNKSVRGIIATWDSQQRRAKVTQSKSQKSFLSLGQNIQGMNGHHQSCSLQGIQYLTLYEALYLIETGQLELFVDDDALSLQEVRT